MHGAPKIILQKSLIRRLVWLLCFFGSWTIFLVQTQLVFRNYFTYPKNTQVEIVSNHRQFPDLTFCFRRGVSFYDAHEWLMKKHERLMRNETLKSTMADMKLVSSFVNDVSLIDPIFYSVEFQAFINRSAITKEEAFVFLQSKSKVHNNAFDYIGPAKEIPGGEFLKCFTISVGTDDIQSIRGYLLTGSGMIPDMSGESEYPWKDISFEEGAVVYIHQPGVKINPIRDKQFYNLQPNLEYSFFVNAKQHIRLGHPYGQCSSRDPFVHGGQRRLDVPYRQQDCELACVADKILDRDRVMPMLYPPLAGIHCWLDENGTLDEKGRYVKRWCNYTVVDTDSGHPGRVNTTQASLYGFYRGLDCPCYPPCNETACVRDLEAEPDQIR